jgi:hypothetical protein
MKQTAVEWLLEYCDRENWSIPNNIIEQAKEMEKKQIIDAFDEGQEYEYQYHFNNTPRFDSETYYNKTFKSE